MEIVTSAQLMFIIGMQGLGDIDSVSSTDRDGKIGITEILSYWQK
jgi:hypothetical protein